MIDGIKIECSYLQPSAWRNSPLLEYFPRIDESTGEVIPQTLAASYQGLAFKIRPSRERPESFYLEIVGSLHRYHNQGGTNAGDFSRSDLERVVNELRERFQVDPARSALRGLEFGVNIELPGPAEEFINGVICMPDKKFTRLNIDRPKLGHILTRTEYDLKIYSKSAQAELVADNVLRVELRAKKMRYLSRFGIHRLADLLEVDKLLLLGKELLATFAEVVFYDGSIEEGKLTNRERKKLEEFSNAHRWENSTKDVRYKAKKAMYRFFALHGGDRPKWNALFAVGNKWLQLAAPPQKMGDDFTAFFESLSADKKATISPLECRVKLSPNTSLDSKEKREINFGRFSTNFGRSDTPENERTFCPICGRDISRQKKGSRYCSQKHFGPKARRCRDRAAGLARTARKRAARQAENLAALQLLELLPFATYELVIYWRTPTGSRSATIQSLTYPAPPDFLTHRVYRLTAQALPDGIVQEFTSKRARMIVTELFKSNR
ncbi:MAG: hypothetical protein AAFP77_16320 [Bacteroidota bacterium]